MAITTELVGRLGGGEVTSIDINFPNPPSDGTYDVITVPVPSGVPHLVALEMKTIAPTGNSGPFLPRLFFDTVDKGSYSSATGLRGAVAVSDAPVAIRAQRNSATPANSAAFTGTVYYCPLGS